MRTRTKPRTAAMVDADGDELRIEVLGDAVYVTASQEECTATVGPFTRVELEALLAVAGAHAGEPVSSHRVEAL